uniref:Uncharacterized protein n=1 Tax=Panagrolaimus sp. JU765 TaxID=591449 RepID=A0AC34PXV2_9BILA
MNQNKILYYKIEKDDEQNTLISSLSKNFEYVCPRFVFGKDYCLVKYYKEGLLWKLKDINGNVKIPFKISFGDEIHVGQAALEHPDFLMAEIDLELLLNDAVHHELPKDSNNIIKLTTKNLKFWGKEG